MADDILTKKRITEYEETATISTLRSDDVMYVDGQTLGTRKMSLLPILNNLFKSSGVSVTDANYSTTITDVNSQPVNTIYTYAANLQSKVSNLPSNFAVTILHFTPIFQASTAPGQVMLAIERTGDNKSLYFRTTSGSPAAWSAWQKVTNESDVEDAITEALNNFSVETDTTLTKSGKPADAKKVGDEISDLKADLRYTQSRTGQLATHTFSGVGGYTTSVYLTAGKTYIIENVSESSYSGVTGIWIDGDTSVVVQMPGSVGSRAEFTPATSGYLRLYNNVASSITISMQVLGDIDIDIESSNASLNDLEKLEDYFGIVKSRNLFNVDDNDNHWGVSKADSYRLSSIGAVYHDTSGMDAIYSVSHMIPVTPGKTVYFSSQGSQTSVFQLACYNSSKVILGSLYNWITEFTIPENAVYIRFCASTLNADFQCEYDARTSYEPWYNRSILQNVGVMKDSIISDDDIIVLPQKMYGVQNKEYDIYIKNIIIGCFDNYILQKSGTGEQMSRRIKYLISQAGTTTTTLALKDSEYDDVCSGQINYINANASAHSGETLKVLAIGDSFINSGYVTQGLINDFNNDVATLQLVGTLGTSPNMHEGRSGWSTYDYVHESSFNGFTNPFLHNGAFDFSYYMNNSGIAVPDYIIINLGINDTWRPMNGTTTAQNIQAMINSIHSYNSNIKVLVGTTPSPYLGDGENGYLANLIENKKRQNITLNVLKNIAENSTVIIVPTHLNFDTDYNFRMGTVAKNGQNSDTIPFCEDVVHPLASGFFQIADSYYACIKAN